MKKQKNSLIFLMLICTISFFGQPLSKSGYNSTIIPNVSDLEISTSPSNLTGIIVLWNGNLSEIPEGWALCDGDNGTPNLTDRFVMSVGEFENPGETGGSLNHTHTYADVPNHDHSIIDPGHTHMIYEKDHSLGAKVSYGTGGLDRAYDYQDYTTTGEYKVYFNPDPAGIEDCETEQFSSLPPFIRLSYIMKTGIQNENVLPAHSILGWVDNFNSIPEGWDLCDGAIFTPNLTDRYIFGTPNQIEMNNYGGNAFHNHSYSDLPLHDHQVDIDYHDHNYGISKVTEDVITGADVFTLDDYPGGTDLSTASTSGITIQEVGSSNCNTYDSETQPPYFRISFITTNTSSSFLPNNSIFYWGKNLNSIPDKSQQYIGSSQFPVYEKFALATANYSLIGTIGGNESHSHAYGTIPRHSHSYVESPHAHSYRRPSTITYGAILDVNGKYVSNPIVSYIALDSASSRVNMHPYGKLFSKTDFSSSLPPYHKLAFVKSEGNLVQIQDSNPIELDWYWWMAIGSTGTLAIIVTISLLNRRKKRKVNPVEK